MPLLRLLSATIVASTALLQAAAQTPKPTPAPPALTTPQPSTLYVTPKLTEIKPLITVLPPVSAQNFTVQVSPTNPLRPQILTAHNDPCYTMRTYGFKAKDLQSPNPRPSTYTDCTPTTSASIKEIHASHALATSQTADKK